MKHTRLLASLLGIHTILDGQNIVQLVNGRNALNLESLGRKPHMKHTLHGKHAAIGLILKADQIGTPPVLHPRLQRHGNGG